MKLSSYIAEYTLFSFLVHFYSSFKSSAFLFCPWIALASRFKRSKVDLEFMLAHIGSLALNKMTCIALPLRDQIESSWHIFYKHSPLTSYILCLLPVQLYRTWWTGGQPALVLGFPLCAFVCSSFITWLSLVGEELSLMHTSFLNPMEFMSLDIMLLKDPWVRQVPTSLSHELALQSVIMIERNGEFAYDHTFRSLFNYNLAILLKFLQLVQLLPHNDGLGKYWSVEITLFRWLQYWTG